MKGKATIAIFAVLIITCLTIPLTGLAKPITEVSPGTAISSNASVTELSVAVILGLVVLLTAFIAIVRLSIEKKAVKFGSTSRHI